MNLRVIHEYRAGSVLEKKMLETAMRLGVAIGQPANLEEALVLVMWLNAGFLDPGPDDLDVPTIGYREAAAIVAAVGDSLGLSQDQMLAAYRRSRLLGPEFDRARVRLRARFENAGWEHLVPEEAKGSGPE